MNVNLNIDLSKLKNMAKKLKEELKEKGISISLMESYDIVSKQIGFKNYNTAIALIKNEKIGKKNVDYTFSFKDLKMGKSIILKIKESLDKLYSLNKGFKHDLFIYDGTIVLNLYFNPNNIAYDAMIIDVMLISFFKKELIENKLIVEKRDLLVRDERISINNSLNQALSYNKS